MTSSNPIPALSHSDQNKGSGQQSSTGGIQAMMPSIFGPAKQTPPEMKGQTCLVTGASRGIGFETALAFAKAHARVVLTSSTESGGREAVAAIKARAGESAEVEWFGADLCDLKQTKEALDAFVAREDRPDLVVLDAGFMRAHDTTADGIEHAFVVNFLSEVLAVNRLLPLLRRTAGRADGGARIVVVTSEHHRFCPSAMHFGSLDEINDPSLTPSQLYGRTKAAQIIATKYGFFEKVVDKYKDPIDVVAVHPGSVATDFQEGWKEYGTMGELMQALQTTVLDRSPEQGSYPVIYAATSPEVRSLGLSGTYLMDPGKAGRETAQCSDRVLGWALWDLSHRLLRDVLGPEGLHDWGIPAKGA